MYVCWKCPFRHDVSALLTTSSPSRNCPQTNNVFRLPRITHTNTYAHFHSRHRWWKNSCKKRHDNQWLTRKLNLKGVWRSNREQHLQAEDSAKIIVWIQFGANRKVDKLWWAGLKSQRQRVNAHICASLNLRFPSTIMFIITLFPHESSRNLWQCRES